MNQLLIRTAIKRAPVCGCGSSSAMWEIIREVLRLAKRRSLRESDVPSNYQPMPERELSGIAVEYVAQSLDHAGFTEHGGSVGYTWLTDAGAALLEFLEAHGCEGASLGENEPGKWPDWSVSSSMNEQFSMTDKEWRSATSTWPGDK